MILLKIIGAVLCFCFITFFIKLGQIASGVNNFCDSLPRGEGWEEEEEFSSDDDYYFRATADGVEAGALANSDEANKAAMLGSRWYG